MFQSTPSAKTEWRQESGYSQQKLWHKETGPPPNQTDPDDDPNPDPDPDPMSMPMPMYMLVHMPMCMYMPMSVPMRMSASVSLSGHGILADYLLGQGETSTCFTRLDKFQSTPSAKTEWRQENGYS